MSDLETKREKKLRKVKRKKRKIEKIKEKIKAKQMEQKKVSLTPSTSCCFALTGAVDPLQVEGTKSKSAKMKKDGKGKKEKAKV